MSDSLESDVSEFCEFIQQLLHSVIEESAKHSGSSCEEFSRDKRLLRREKEENGFYYVDDLMQKWNKLPELKKWHYSIDHIDEISGETLKYHAFQIKWAKPMIGYTHPIIVVNVYLFVKMILDRVEMSYNFEGSRFVRDARFPFNPQWLINAYYDKRNVITTLSL